MILDARSESVRLDRTAQIAIVGAGPAGLTLARELADVDDVIVIEGGGFESESNPHVFLGGECAGLDYPLTETRARQFGGSSSLWAGYCALFDALDFQPRAWVPGSGWPIDIGSIRPYFGRTAALLNLGDANFDARDIATRVVPGFPFEDARIVPTVWRFGTPTLRLGDQVRGEFETSAVTTMINATVVELELDSAHGAVTRLKIRTRNGREGHVSADLVVLACGGLETPRLLLGSAGQLPHGVGNSHGVVGRYFMEHPHRQIPFLSIRDAAAFANWTARGRYDEQREFCFCAGLPMQIQKDAGILNARAHVYWTPQMRPDEAPRVGLFLEQAPNPESRVSLADATDPLGIRRIRLDWRLTDLDWHTYRRTAVEIAMAFERHGAGRRCAAAQTMTPESAPVLHSNHHLGTTRMSDRPQDGVVNSDCRVHDIGNLYIAGGSVFPTVSWANPTFTVIALTLRLADCLRRRLSHGQREKQQTPLARDTAACPDRRRISG